MGPAGPIPAVQPEPEVEPGPDRDPIRWLRGAIEKEKEKARLKIQARVPEPSSLQRWLWLLENKPPEYGRPGQLPPLPYGHEQVAFDVDELRKLCAEVGLLDEYVDLLLRDFDYLDGSGGVDIGYRGPRNVTVDLPDSVNERLIRLCCCSNDMSKKESDDKVREIQAWLHASALADARLGRVAGPFKRHEIPYPHFRVSPRFAVPKPGSAKYRPIHHLSYPRRARKGELLGINQDVTRGWTEKLARLEDVIADVLLIASTGSVPRIALSDCAAAYRQIPVRYQDHCLLGYRCGEDYFFEKRLPFGLSSAMQIYCGLSRLLKKVVTRRADPWLCKQRPRTTIRRRARFDDPWFKARTRVDSVQGVHTFVDDSTLVSTSDKIAGLEEANRHVYERVRLPLCAKKAAEGYAGPPQRRVLGTDIDCDRLRARVPNEKLHILRAMLTNFEKRYRDNRRRPRQQELMQLIGKLQYVSRVVDCAEGFLQEMSRVAHSVTELHHHVRLTEAFWMEFVFWKLFLRDYDGVSLVHKFQTRSPRWFLATDASGFGIGPARTTALPSFPGYLPCGLRPSGAVLAKHGHSEWRISSDVFAQAMSHLRRFTARSPVLDGFASAGNQLCRLFFTKRQNALLRDVAGWFMWLNPPFHLWPLVGAWLLDAAARDGRTGAVMVLPEYVLPSCPDLMAATIELFRIPAGSPCFTKYLDGRPLFSSPAPLRWDVSVRVLLPCDNSLTAHGRAAIVRSVQARAGGFGGWLADSQSTTIRYFTGTWPAAAVGLPIHVLENIAYWLALQKWSCLWGSDHVLIGNDNQAVLAVAAKHRAKNPTLRRYGQAAALLEGKASWTADKGYVSTKDNYYADALSRGDVAAVTAELTSLGYQLTRDCVADLMQSNVSLANSLRSDQWRKLAVRAPLPARCLGSGNYRPRTSSILPDVCLAPSMQPSRSCGRALGKSPANHRRAGSCSDGSVHQPILRDGHEVLGTILRLVQS